MFFKKKNKPQEEKVISEKEDLAPLELSPLEEIKEDILEEKDVSLPDEEEIISIEEQTSEDETPLAEPAFEEEIQAEEIEKAEPSETISIPEKIEEKIQKRPEPEEAFEENKDGKIYILGDNALACFFAMKFSNAGEKVVLVANKEKASSLSNNGITIIENHSLQKKHYKFETTFWVKETPKMLIITSDAAKLNASLTAISRKKIIKTPVLLFTPIKDTFYIKNILENNIYRAFFDGYLLNQLDQILLYGRSPSVVFSPKGKAKEEAFISKTFEEAGLSIKQEPNEDKAFWEFFSVYTACSLVSAAYNKNIFDVIKDKEKRETLIPLIKEISMLAKIDGVELNDDEVLKKYITPLSYPYPLQVEIAKGKAGDFDLISTNITNIAKLKKCKISELNALLKKIYNIIMA